MLIRYKKSNIQNIKPEECIAGVNLEFNGLASSYLGWIEYSKLLLNKKSNMCITINGYRNILDSLKTNNLLKNDFEQYFIKKAKVNNNSYYKDFEYIIETAEEIYEKFKNSGKIYLAFNGTSMIDGLFTNSITKQSSIKKLASSYYWDHTVVSSNGSEEFEFISKELGIKTVYWTLDLVNSLPSFVNKNKELLQYLETIEGNKIYLGEMYPMSKNYIVCIAKNKNSSFVALDSTLISEFESFFNSHK